MEKKIRDPKFQIRDIGHIALNLSNGGFKYILVITHNLKGLELYDHDETFKFLLLLDEEGFEKKYSSIWIFKHFVFFKGFVLHLIINRILQTLFLYEMEHFHPRGNIF